MYSCGYSIVLNCGIVLSTHAQSNQIEAKAAYLLAEESFAKGDYVATLEYLENSTKSLGTTNSKLLYLKIQAELELYKKDKTYYDALIKSISDFQNSPDVNNYTEEKVLEIAKTKMLLVKEREQEAKKKEEYEQKKALRDLNFKTFSFPNWPFGVTLDELKITHKDTRFFQNKTKKSKEENTGLRKSGLVHYHPNGITLQGGGTNAILFPWDIYFDDIYGILAEDNIVKGYRKAIYWQRYKNDQGISQEQSITDLKKIVNDLSNQFGFQPEYIHLERSSSVYREIYRWANGNKAVSIYTSIRSERNGYWNTWVVQEIMEE